MKKKTTLGIIAVLMIGGVFCYYEVRPAMIRNECHWEAIEKIGGFRYQRDSNRIDYSFLYKFCLNNKGIKE